jgi:hypothetical protein
MALRGGGEVHHIGGSRGEPFLAMPRRIFLDVVRPRVMSFAA